MHSTYKKIYLKEALNESDVPYGRANSCDDSSFTHFESSNT
ncbi:hypothetical protein BN1317_30169 [Staphylococcus capitis]|nr:hypothetical protein BN1317_30169 [Staphylococcus capitis]